MAEDTPPKDMTTAFEPHSSIREIIGKKTKLEEIFTEERINASQKIIADAQTSFFDDVQSDMSKLEQAITAASKATEEKNSLFDPIAQHTHNICGHARLFGFGFIEKLCLHIMSNCENRHKSFQTHIALIGKIYQALNLAIKMKIKGEGDEVGKEITASLKNFVSE